MNKIRIKKYLIWLLLALVILLLPRAYVDVKSMSYMKNGYNGTLLGSQFKILVLGSEVTAGGYYTDEGMFEIKKTVYLTSQQAQELKNILGVVEWMHGLHSMCHAPGFVIEGSTIFYPLDRVSVCFMCDNVEYGGSFVRGQENFSKKDWSTLKNFLVQVTSP